MGSANLGTCRISFRNLFAQLWPGLEGAFCSCMYIQIEVVRGRQLPKRFYLESLGGRGTQQLKQVTSPHIHIGFCACKMTPLANKATPPTVLPSSLKEPRISLGTVKR